VKTWQKLGQLFDARAVDSYLDSHASNPMPVHLCADVYRVFYSGRDLENRSSVAYVDIDILQHKVLDICKKSVFTYGPPGSFYSHGVSIGNCYSVKESLYVLFMGWQLESGKHWRGDIGRLILHGKNTLSLCPVEKYMGVDEEDKISLSYPWVLHDGHGYKMWYGSTVSWHSENGEMIHVIKYATSADGENWRKHGVAIPYKLGVAQAFSRPTVILHEGTYHMWFSYRSGSGEKYKIGYAESRDGTTWEMHLAAGLDVSASGWDSEMVCYPFVFKHKDSVYMLYNGNGFGATGFGLAKLLCDRRRDD